jgi:hypothetical protein
MAAACERPDCHFCHRAKRGAASGQQSLEVTQKDFRRLVVSSSCRERPKAAARRRRREHEGSVTGAVGTIAA